MRALLLGSAVGLLAAVSGQAALIQTSSTTWTDAYSGLNAEETWTAPTTGVYQFTVVGAAGGASYGYRGGYGAEVIASFALSADQQITLAVGQMGYGGDNAAAVFGGGGGGSFVVSAGAPLAVAGGGGGGGGAIGANASTTMSGTNTAALGGTNGSGGSTLLNSPQYWYGAGAGAGFYSDGESYTSTVATGGKDWADGLAGGLSDYYGAVSATYGGGGYGGGGGAYYSGGGGGYSGGAGGNGPNYGGGGGGGGSYVAGTALTSSLLAGIGTGNGSITITDLTVPAPTGITLLPALVAVFRRRRTRWTAASGK